VDDRPAKSPEAIRVEWAKVKVAFFIGILTFGIGILTYKIQQDVKGLQVQSEQVRTTKERADLWDSVSGAWNWGQQ